MSQFNKNLTIQSTVKSGDAEIPKLGIGTYKMNKNDLKTILPLGLDLGIRHIDTAQMYGNEGAIGHVLSESEVGREELFLTTKLWHTNLEPPKARSSFEDSLRKLKTEYVDLLLIHWPNDDVPMKDTLDVMHELHEEGKVKHIGVSNFNTTLWKYAILHSELPIVTNQVEYHPLLNQDALLDVTEKHELSLTAYRPIAANKVADIESIGHIAEKYGKSPAQIALRWLLEQKRVIAIPKTATPKHLKANANIFDFQLTEDEHHLIKREQKLNLRQLDPPFAPEWD